MRILATTDVHGSNRALDFIETYSSKHEPDLLCIAGDITHFGPAEWAREWLDQIEMPCLAIPGNCDPPETLGAIEASKATALHLKREVVDGIGFVGLGGSSPTPFPTLFEWEDDYALQIEGLLDPASVLLSRGPPRGSLDDTHFRGNVGSQSLRDIIDRKVPRLVICGHIHEARGPAALCRTKLVNPGMLARGYAALVDIQDTIEIELLSL